MCDKHILFPSLIWNCCGIIHAMDIQVIRLHSTDSTNEWIKRNIDRLDASKITVVCADHQTAGRGTRGKTWFSPPNRNLYVSFYFTTPESFHCENIAQVAALSIVDCLAAFELRAQIKLPNDVLVIGKKIAGVLCETLCLSHRKGIVVGIGLNVHMTQKELSTIDQAATSLWVETKQMHSLPFLLKMLCEYFHCNLQVYLHEGFNCFESRFSLLLKN